MIIKNKLTREKLELTDAEFFAKFEREIRVAFESYKATIVRKSYYKIPDKTTIESDFNNNLVWNFNHLSNSNWYILKL